MLLAQKETQDRDVGIGGGGLYRRDSCPPDFGHALTTCLSLPQIFDPQDLTRPFRLSDLATPLENLCLNLVFDLIQLSISSMA